MTTFVTETLVCGVCGRESEQPVLTSTSSFGPVDLDTRPSEPARSALWLQIQTCPVCHYCARRIDDGDDGMRPILDGEEYRRQLADERYPELARAFLCASLVLDEVGQAAEATWSAIEAAWACDDADAGDAARECRTRALTLMEKALATGEPLAEDEASHGAIATDLLRRAGRFDDARDRAVATLDGDVPPIVRAVLELEVQLIERRDDRVHSLDFADA